jgi:large subunit ribosomal protein L25
MHVDFVRVRADQTIQAEIPVHLTGESEGAGRGGVLEQMIHTLTIEALPGDIPSSIEHDVTALEIGDAARVADLAIPSGVTVQQEAEEIVVQVSAPRVAEEAAPAEGEEGAAEGAAPAAAAEGDSAGE